MSCYVATEPVAHFIAPRKVVVSLSLGASWRIAADPPRTQLDPVRQTWPDLA